MKTIQRVIEIPLEEVRSQEYDRNLETHGEGENTCLICGKPITTIPKKWVQLLTSGNIVSTDQPNEESQGFFPVGNDCAKRLVIKFTF